MIDTIKVHTADYEVDQRSKLKLRQGIVNCDTGEIENQFFLYRDRLGCDHHGAGAFLNSPYFNLDISNRGLFLKYTPAKNFHGNNYYSVNNNQLKIVSQEIEEILSDCGIYMSMESADLSRVDLARNVHTDRPVAAYYGLLGLLSGQRMKTSEYPTGFRYGNKSRQCVFYDKIEELLQVQKINLAKYGIPDLDTLRGELRFMSKRVINRDLPHTKLGQLYKKSNYEDLKDSYKHYFKKLVFKSEPDQKLKFHYTREVELLQELKKRSKRGVVDRYFKLRSLDQVLKMFGTLDNFKLLLLEAGFERTYVWRQINDLHKLMKLGSAIDKKYESDTITQLYEEITTKLLN